MQGHVQSGLKNHIGAISAPLKVHRSSEAAAFSEAGRWLFLEPLRETWEIGFKGPRGNKK